MGIIRERKSADCKKPRNYWPFRIWRGDGSGLVTSKILSAATATARITPARHTPANAPLVSLIPIPFSETAATVTPMLTALLAHDQHHQCRHKSKQAHANDTDMTIS